MKLCHLSVGQMDVNCYVLWDEATKDAVVIDPGDEPARILRTITNEKLNVRYILLTHAHCDHIGGLLALKSELGAPVVLHEKEQPLLQDERLNLSAMMGGAIKASADILLKDQDEIRFGSCSLKVLHTPGHTVGGVCFYHAESKQLFSGDTLFYTSIGRCDFPGGDFQQITASIQNKLYVLPDDVVVYPGHGEKTSIGFEKQHNGFVRGNV